MSRLRDVARIHPLATLVAAVGTVVTVLAMVMLLTQPWGQAQLLAELARLDALDAAQLSDEKLRQEIAEAVAANLTGASPWGSVLAILPVITGLLGGVAVFATIWKQITERSDQLREDREERERELDARRAETFKTTTENLSAQSPSLRASAAATLSTFLRPEYATYREELLLVSIAKSKKGMESDKTVARLVTRAVELAMRATIGSISEADRRFLLDLTRCQLRRIDLRDLDLHDVDIAFADLSEAQLAGANLYRARGGQALLEKARVGASDKAEANLREARFQKAIAPEAQFHNAICVSIRLEDADLMGAEFFEAKLQEGHFERADLTGAKFNGADLNNAYFYGATIDDAALRSIATGARHWREAHFDPEHRERLEVLSERASRPRGQAAGITTREAEASGTPQPSVASAPALAGEPATNEAPARADVAAGDKATGEGPRADSAEA